MKLEIIKETEIGKEPWYRLLADGEYITGSYILKVIEERYELLKKGVPQKTVEILKSEKIDVPLPETN